MTLAHLRTPTAAYIHVPFCAHRCGYCDFTLVAGRDDLIEKYLQALEVELSAMGTPRVVSTLFVGGGTPTHLASGQLDRLLAMVHRWFRLKERYEFSVEANPAGFDDEKLSVLAAHGVNRISLGVQSFDAAVLKTLERDHDAQIVGTALARIRRRIDNFSLDLIFGVPGQSLETWRDTLARAIALRPMHISTYGLTFEKGTSFWSRRRKGILVAASGDLERAMYAAAMDELVAAGYLQYELSNFAMPGAACRHNETYWSGLSYFGAGPGAARYVGGRRETNHRSVSTWLARVLAGSSPTGDAEVLSPEDRAREALVLGLRRTRGVDRSEFLADTGFELDALTAGRIERWITDGLVESAPESLRLAAAGRFVADSIVVDLL
jgi:oxygen-independent coproporphyrinogen-3 oxidase